MAELVAKAVVTMLFAAVGLIILGAVVGAAVDLVRAVRKSRGGAPGMPPVPGVRGCRPREQPWPPPPRDKGGVNAPPTYPRPSVQPPGQGRPPAEGTSDDRDHRPGPEAASGPYRSPGERGSPTIRRVVLEDRRRDLAERVLLELVRRHGAEQDTHQLAEDAVELADALVHRLEHGPTEMRVEPPMPTTEDTRRALEQLNERLDQRRAEREAKTCEVPGCDRPVVWDPGSPWMPACERHPPVFYRGPGEPELIGNDAIEAELHARLRRTERDPDEP